jgi:ribosomal protein S21
LKFVVETKSRKGESFEGLYRRFSKRVQQSGNMLEARKTRFFSAKPNKTKQKSSALRRLKVAAKREYLIRVGQLTEDRRNRGQRRS